MFSGWRDSHKTTINCALVELDVKRSSPGWKNSNTWEPNGAKINKEKFAYSFTIDPRTNFCGAYWSDGKFQSSVANPTVEPTNDFDSTCRDHDVSIATAKTQEEVLAANQLFYDRNINKSLYRSIVALAVLHLYPFSMPPSKKKNNTPTMRSVENAVSRALVVYNKTQKPKSTPTPKKQKAKKNNVPAIMTTSLPATIGTTLRGAKPNIVNTGGRIRVTGREFVVTLPENNQSNWYLSAMFPIHPAYFKSTVLANYCRSYERFTFNGGNIHFITRQPSSATGEILMYSVTNVNDTAYLYNSSDFLSCAFSLQNAVMGPVWSNHTLKLPSGKASGLTNPLIDTDINDNMKGEVNILTQSGITDNAGFILFDYDFTFYDPMYSTHVSLIPVPTGPTDIKLYADTSNETLGSQASWVLDSEYSSLSNGTIFKIVLNSTGTTYAAGTTSANALRLVSGTSFSGFTLADGITFYGVVVGASLLLWPTLVSAKDQSTSVYIAYNVTVAAKATWAFSAYMVQMGNGAQMSQN